jgi:putative tryptophan/tyrosine transport system substrate-binding protein
MRRRDLIALLGGAAALWPAVARAQHKPMPVIGYLVGTSPRGYEPFLDAFRHGLNESGFVEGRNVAIEYRWADGDYDRLAGLAADLVSRNVDLIATAGGVAARTARKATSTVPIVFMGVSDPVRDGLIASLARPAGNVTGVTFLTAGLYPKRLELLSELVPQAKVLPLLVNPNDADVGNQVQEAARARGWQVPILKASSESDIDAAFEALVRLQAGGLVVGGGPFFRSRHERIVALASRNAVPAIYAWRETVAAGGLISYGASFASAYRQAGIYAGKILNGAKPADLPVQQPTTFELAVNLNTAKALGLAVSASLLARADEVIE